MSAILNKVLHSDKLGAVRFVLSGEVESIGLSELESAGEPQEMRRLMAEVLHIVKPTNTLAIVRTSFQGGTSKMAKMNALYHRIVYCRDVMEASLFAIVTKTSVETINLLQLGDQLHIGAHVAVFEPEFLGKEVSGVPLVTTGDPLIPFLGKPGTYLRKECPAGTTAEMSMQAFFIFAPEIGVIKPGIDVTCSGTLCDRQGGKDCPCIKTGPLDAWAIGTYLKVAALPNVSDRFTSLQFSRIFIEEVLLDGGTERIDVFKLRRVVRAIVAFHNGKDRGWWVSGWVKLGKKDSDEVAGVNHVYISSVVPRESGGDEEAPPPKYRLQPADEVGFGMPQIRGPMAHHGASPSAAMPSAQEDPRR